MLSNLQKKTSQIDNKRLEIKNIENVCSKGLADFVTSKTICFFNAFDIEMKFFKKPVSVLPEDDTFKKGQAIVAKIAVVNDRAERSISLITKFNSSLTKDEEQKQYLLKTVKQNREKYVKKTKREVIAN